MGWSLRVISGSGFAFYGLGFWQVSLLNMLQYSMQFPNFSWAYSPSFSTASEDVQEHIVKTISYPLKITQSTWRFTIWVLIP
jgi:hypothetical protein